MDVEWDELDKDWQGIQGGDAIPFAGYDGLDGSNSGDMDIISNDLYSNQRCTPAFERRLRQPREQMPASGGSFDPDPTLFDAAANASRLWQQGSTEDNITMPSLETSEIDSSLGHPTDINDSHHQSGSPEDAAFAEVLADVMRERISPSDAVLAYADICRHRAQELRTIAAGQLQRATRYVSLRDDANALDEEAATWHLLWHLSGDTKQRFPGGWGGGEDNAAAALASGRTTVHQQVAAIIAEDDAINRAARVVAWLEALAAEALDLEAALTATGGGTAGRFSAKEGVWTETQIRLAAGVASQGGHHLVSELDPDAPGRQKRPLHPENTADEDRILLRLWRLVRAGRLEEAQLLCRECGQPWRAVSLGGGGRRGPTPVGKPASAADAPDSSASESRDEMAAQVFDGDMAPRSLWRCSMLHAAEAAAASADTQHSTSASTSEAAVYGVLAGDLASVLPACKQWEDILWALLRCWLDITVDSVLCESMELDPVHGLDPDLLLAAVPGDGSSAILRDFLTVQQGGWPLHRVAEKLPQHFEAVLTDDGVPEAAAVQAALSGHHRGLQAALILDQPQQVLDHLVAWVLPAGADKPMSSAGDMRFAAHFALALRSTGFIDQPSWQADQYDPLQEGVGEVVQAYLVHAMSIGATALVPQLSCHLRSGRRHITYAIFAEQLTVRPVEECRRAFEAAASWFSSWQGGDVLPDESSIIANQIAKATRGSPAGGPMFRAQSARWLTFSEGTVAAALRHAVLLARELGMGLAAAPGPSCAAGCALLHQVLAAGAPGRLLAMSPQHLSELQLPDDVASSLAEVRLWSDVFANEQAFQEFLQQQDRIDTPSATAATELLEEFIVFLTGGRFETLLAAIQVEEAVMPEVAITAVPTALMNPHTDAETTALTAGNAFPVIAPGEAKEAATLLQKSLQAALAGSPALAGLETHAAEFEARSSEESAPTGLMSLRVWAGSSLEAWPAKQAVAATAAAAIKGSLPGEGDVHGAGLLWVLNANGTDACVAETAWRLIAPRLILQAAELRQAAISAGAGEDVGRELAAIVAGVPRQTGVDAVGLAPLLSSLELQEYLEWERSTAVIAMHNKEASNRQQPQAENATPSTSDGYIMV